MKDDINQLPAERAFGSVKASKGKSKNVTSGNFSLLFDLLKRLMTGILEQVIVHGSLALLSTRIFSVSMALTTSECGHLILHMTARTGNVLRNDSK